jgi:hypothetical protein
MLSLNTQPTLRVLEEQEDYPGRALSAIDDGEPFRLERSRTAGDAVAGGGAEGFLEGSLALQRAELTFAI